MKREPIGEILVRKRILSEEQLERALDYHRAHRCRLGEALLALGYCSEVQLYSALAKQLGMPFVDLEETPPTGDALRRLSRSEAERLHVVPVRMMGPRLLVAALSPMDFHLDSLVRELAGVPVLIACGVPSQIHAALEHYGRTDVANLDLANTRDEPFCLVNRRLEEAFQPGVRKLLLEVDAETVTVSIRERDGERMVARLPADRLQVRVGARRSGRWSPPSEEPVPAAVRFNLW